MNYELRISRVEAQLEMNQKDIERLYQAIVELRRLLLERFDQIDMRFSEERKYIDLHFIEERKYIDQRFGEERQYLDQRLAEERQYLEQRFSEERQKTDLGFGILQDQIKDLRHEVTVNMRWMLGMWLTTVGMFAGVCGKVFGIY